MSEIEEWSVIQVPHPGRDGSTSYRDVFFNSTHSHIEIHVSFAVRHSASYHLLPMATGVAHESADRVVLGEGRSSAVVLVTSGRKLRVHAVTRQVRWRLDGLRQLVRVSHPAVHGELEDWEIASQELASAPTKVGRS